MSDELRGLLEGKLGEAVSAAADYAADAIAPATRAAYIRDWDVFTTWCREQGADANALPTHPVLVAAYIASLAGAIGKSALRGRLAAIAYHHRRRGLTWSGAHPAIRETLAGIGRAHGKPVRPSAALTSVEVKRLIAGRAQDLAGLRDRALFLVGLAGAFRRSELVAIDMHHLRFEADCVVVRLPRSKGDQAGKGLTSRCRACAAPTKLSATPARCARWRLGCDAPRSGAGRCSAASRRTGPWRSG